MGISIVLFVFLILTLLIDGSYKYRRKKQPKYIAIEDLNVKRMMKNKYLARDIANCSFFTLSKKKYLIRKIIQYCKVVWLVDRFYPSSKTCSNCGSYKKDLKLGQRIYHCYN